MTGPEAPIILLLCSLTGSMLLARVAPSIVARASNGTATISREKALVACLIGCLPGLFALSSGSFSVQISFLSLGIVLMLLAALDRQTSWAPDLLMIPLCCLAMWVGAQHAGEEPGILRLVLRGIGFFAMFQVLYLVLSRHVRMIPPPDMIGLATPFVVFGTSMLTAASFIIVSGILIAIRQHSSVRNVILVPNVGDDICEGRGFSIPFLAIILPVVFVLLFWSPLIHQGD